jgi:hypothetical protein
MNKRKEAREGQMAGRVCWVKNKLRNTEKI